MIQAPIGYREVYIASSPGFLHSISFEIDTFMWAQLKLGVWREKAWGQG